MFRRLLALSVMFAALLMLSGCTLLGLGVGSQIPHFEPIKQATRGDALRVHLANGDVLRGAAVVVTDTSITVLDNEDSREHEIALKQIVRLYRRRGSELLSTLMIGAITDGLAVTSLIIAAALGAFAPH
jgi:hypothetical protein